MELHGPAKILVIENEPITAANLRDELHNLGYEVTGLASSSEDALLSIASHHPDMVLLGSHFQQQPGGAAFADVVRSRFRIPVTLSPYAIGPEILAHEAPYLDGTPAVAGTAPVAESMDLAQVGAQMRQKYFWLSTALNSAADAIVIVDSEGTVQFLNPVAQQLTGRSQEYASGKHFTDVLVFEHHGEPLTDDLVRLATFNEEPLSLGKDLVLVSSDGRRRQVDAEISAASEMSGAFGSAVFTVRDVTQRKWEEHQQRQEHAIRAVERLAENTAHTLNNLLTTILGNGELLLNSPDLDEEHRDSVNRMHSSALRVAAVVRQLSSISRTKFVTRQELDINALIEAFLPVLEKSLPPGVKLKTDLDPQVRSVSADRDQLEQVIFNLFTNAQDAIAHAGEITISTANFVIDASERCKTVRKYATVKIRDNGEGMSDKTSERIFEPFFTMRNHGGRVGLGLSITRGIISDYHGFLDVKTELGVGTEMTFGLPSIEPDPFSYLDATADDPKSNAVKTVLLVEDDHAVRLLVRKILEKHDYQVIEAQDGEDALTVAELHDGRVDVLVTDLAMPGLSGPDLVRQFAPLHPETRFLLISGFSSNKIGDSSSLPRGLEFLQKPFKQKDLLAQIQSLISDANRGR